jgi:hypothetical protein
MSQYTTLLLGGKKPRKAVSAEIASKRLEALARGRATRMANIKGKGYYNQDYVANGQVNYAGNPVDMLGPQHPKDHSKGNSDDDESEGFKTLMGQGKKKMSKEDKECMRMAEEEMMKGNGLTRPQKRQLKKSSASKQTSNMNALPEAIQVLGHLASLFGMKMMHNE